MATQIKDERVAQTSLATKLLQRPELGALIGAAVIFFLFWSVDTTGNFAAVGGTAGWTDIAAPIGIIAVFVALLMIGENLISLPVSWWEPRDFLQGCSLPNTT